MTPLQILKKARKLLITKGWTQNYYARDKWGHSVEPTSPRAVKFCALGALYKAVPANDARMYARLELENALPIDGTGAVNIFNDSHPKAAVIALYDRAIQRLGGR